MKKIVIAIAGVLALLLGTLVYNVWRAGIEPVTVTPGALEAGRHQLRDQLEQSKQRENEIEQQDWNTITLLRELVKAHQQRVDQLSGNGEAGEIVAWDRESIARIEKRIAELVARQSAQPISQDQNAGDATQAPEHAAASAAPGSVAIPRTATTTSKPLIAALPKVPATTTKTTASTTAKPAATPKPPPTVNPKPPAQTPQPPSGNPETPATPQSPQAWKR